MITLEKKDRLYLHTVVYLTCGFKVQTTRCTSGFRWLTLFYRPLCGARRVPCLLRRRAAMKFGKLLKLNALPEWKDFYIDYKGLKGTFLSPPTLPISRGHSCLCGGW